MYIEQKQNRIYKPTSNTTLSAEESNQVTTELQNLITAGNLTPSAGTLTQVRDAVQNVVNVAKNDLQEQIDAITSASDVFDVVGTYAELQAYDTSTVPINDIIKVLQDSTHNNAATYYRLVDESGALTWQYVGQEGPYYTKSETDLTFATKSELPGIATTSQVGLVKPDGQTVTVQADGTLNVSSNVAASLPLFTSIWADHILNNASYLRADTFSWQSGSVYTSAYQHLVADISGITSETETISGTTITFYRATDGHKIVLPDQESNVEAIYIATGMAWYYILDTTNTRFKLPRSTHGNMVEKYQNGTEWYRVWSDGWCEQGGQVSVGSAVWLRVTFLKPFTNTNYNIQASYLTTTGSFVNSTIGIIKYTNTYADMSVYGVGFDASWRACGYISSPAENAQYKYLYFYVGNTIQNETSVDVAELTEGLNGKADTDLGNLSNAGKIQVATLAAPSDTYDDLVLGASGNTYTMPADGYLFLWIDFSGSYSGIQVYDTSTHRGESRYSSGTVSNAITFAVHKGEVIGVNYWYASGYTTQYFRFFYAEGSKSLA